MSHRTRIAIACQGGASQTAFAAGALIALFRAGVHERFDIVSLSGTSGGAICALLAWTALQKQEADPGARLAAFWADNTASTPAERSLNALGVQTLRAVNHGLLPIMNTSPAMPLRQAASSAAAWVTRPEFSDLRTLLRRHVDFAEIAAWGPRGAGPNLLVGAVDVLAGMQRIFASRLAPIGVDHILASAAVPEMFPAVRLEGSAFWDGLYSDNPPVIATLRPALVGEEHVPEEVWVIKISPTAIRDVPESPDAINARRLQLVSNLSLFQQIEMLEVFNQFAARGALQSAFLRDYGLSGAVRHPRAFGAEPRPWHIPFIEMSHALSARLGHESMIDRSPETIGALMRDGEAQARAFLHAREAQAG